MKREKRLVGAFLAGREQHFYRGIGKKLSKTQMLFRTSAPRSRRHIIVIVTFSSGLPDSKVPCIF